MSKFTDQRDKDVNRILEFQATDATFYTLKELLQRAWEWGHAYREGYDAPPLEEDDTLD